MQGLQCKNGKNNRTGLAFGVDCCAKPALLKLHL